MTLERILLQTIKFDLMVEHPYAYLLKFAKLIKGSLLVDIRFTFVFKEIFSVKFDLSFVFLLLILWHFYSVNSAETLQICQTFVRFVGKLIYDC